MSRRTAPRLGSTYRLQLHGLGFAGATECVPYLDSLGVETLYLSPVLCARRGSTHGYDVVDPARLDPDLGSAADLAGLFDALARHGMRALLDIVPNHMAASDENPYWLDVLRHGRSARHAAVFDIDWDAGDGRVVLPVLDAPLAEVLAAGRLHVEDGAVVGGGDRFPLRPGTRPEGVGAGALARLLDRQHYRLVHWRAGRHEGNYRTFFDIADLVGVRVEDPAVFDLTHGVVLDLAAHEAVAGVRVDHVDGLADPQGYLARLGADLEARAGGRRAVLVEKILARGEELPVRWAVDGTTGYEFADVAGGLFVDPLHREEAVAALEARCRRLALADLLPGAFARLGDAVAVAAVRPGLDLPTADVARALEALTVAMPVYRTYVGPAGAGADDRRAATRAARAAARRLDADGRRALEAVLGLLGFAGPPFDPVAVRRWQQLCPAVAAKGVEDTALYRLDGPLVGAEVGGSPGAPGVGEAYFHGAMSERRRRMPGALNATTTHDTKRSEDVRARLAVLARHPHAWERRLARWRRANAGAVRRVSGRRVPDEHEERYLYETLVGVWPDDGHVGADFVRRVQDHVEKAAHEAKRATSWRDPDAGHDRALRAFVARVLRQPDSAFAAEVARTAADVGRRAAAESLCLVALKCTAPGVPDVYQGTERPLLALTDPDNRRPVDFDGAAARLAALPEELDAPVPWPRLDAASARLLVTARLLRARRRESALFSEGSYRPLTVTGAPAGGVLAFARVRRRRWAVTVVALRPGGRRPRLAGPVAVGLPAGAPAAWRDVVTGARHESSAAGLDGRRLLAALPFAVVVGGGRRHDDLG